MISNRFPFIFLFPFLCLIFWQGYGQIPLSRSAEKVELQGKTYYLHKVQKGQTLYSISKGYNIPENEIAEANPDVFEGVGIDQVLRIPVVPGRNATVAEMDAAGRYFYHYVETGQTMFFLQERFQMTRDELVTHNPGLGNRLKTGTVVRIPIENVRKKGAKPAQGLPIQDGSGPDSVKIDKGASVHVVKPGDTFFSIARGYGIPPALLQKANPAMDPKSLPIGLEISIPGDSVPPPVPKIALPEPPPLQERHEDFRVAVFLPFFLQVNDTIGRSDTLPTTDPDGQLLLSARRIFPRSQNFLEMYQGILLAALHLRQKGIRLELSVYDAPRDTNLLKQNLKKLETKRPDLIIGPVYTEELVLAARFALENQIPVLAPLSSRKDLLQSNPYAIQAIPSQESQESYFAEFLASDPAFNLILVKNPAKPEPSFSKFKAALDKNLNYNYPGDSIRLHEMDLTQTNAAEKLASTDPKINPLRKLLKKGKTNMVVVMSNDQAYVTNLVTVLNRFREGLDTTYSLALGGFASWQKFDNINLAFLFNLGFYCFSTTYVDYSTAATKEFVGEFRREFFGEPSEFAFQGYDLLGWFAQLAARGREPLLKKIGDGAESPYQPLQTGFRFRPVASGGGFENTRVSIIRYLPDLTVERVEPGFAASKPKLFRKP